LIGSSTRHQAPLIGSSTRHQAPSIGSSTRHAHNGDDCKEQTNKKYQRVHKRQTNKTPEGTLGSTKLDQMVKHFHTIIPEKKIKFKYLINASEVYQHHYMNAAFCAFHRLLRKPTHRHKSQTSF